MKKLALSLTVLMALLSPALDAAPAQAQNFHSWVSHSGSDVNACSLAAPCASIDHALHLTLGAGIVSCLDSGDFGPFTVTASVSIDCVGTVGTPNTGSSSVCGNKIYVNAPGQVVNLRALHVGGQAEPCDVDAILIQAAAVVVIEDCVIENSSKRGILDQRTTGLTKLVIKSSIVRNNGSAGIVVAAVSANSVVLENVQSVGNAYGIGVAAGNNVVISRSVMSENSVAGIEADPGADVVVENTKISHNIQYGILALGTVTLANSDISFNNSSINGSTLSYGNNRLFGNGAGTAPTLISQQ